MTIYQRFREIAAKFQDREFIAELQDGRYQALTYGQVQKLVNQLAAGLEKQGLKSGDHLAFMLPNGLHWIITDLACGQLGLVTVPIHTTYGENNIQHIIKDSQTVNLIINKTFYDKFKNLIDSLSLKKVIIEGESEGLNFDSLLKAGELAEESAATDTTPHTIVYTSGTTGHPKGVVLSYQNMLADVDSAKRFISVSENDRFFSFMPLSHMFERAGAYYTSIVSGAAIYFATGPKNIGVEIKLAKPTIITAVPRIFERVYEKIFEKVEAGPAWKRRLFHQAINLSRRKLKGESANGLLLKLLDRLVLAKVRQSLGGRLRFAVSGGASLDRKIARFFETIGIVVLEGYGLTEILPFETVSKREYY